MAKNKIWYNFKFLLKDLKKTTKKHIRFFLEVVAIAAVAKLV